MKSFLLFLFLVVTQIPSCAQVSLNQFIGSWEGFGFVEINQGKYFLNSVLSVEKLPGKTDSLRCLFTTIPNGQNYFISSKIESYVFNAGIKDNALILPANKQIPLLYKSARFVLTTPNGKSSGYASFSIASNGAIGTAESYFIKNATSANSTFYKDVSSCYKIQSDRAKKDFIATGVLRKYKFSDELSQKIVQDFERREIVQCLKENIDFESIKYTYINEIGLLIVNISNLVPLYFPLEKEKAKDIVARKAALFEFEDFDYSLGAINIISTKAARMKVPLSNLDLHYSDTSVNQIVFDTKFASFIRSAAITKK